MKPLASRNRDCRQEVPPRRRLTLMIVLTIVLAHVTHPSAVHADLSYEAYAQEISAELGPAYLEQYQQLTRGDYRYPPHTAQYMVYAFYHGWQSGYYAGSWAPYNRANGHHEHQRQLEVQWSQVARNQVNQWTGVRGDEYPLLMSFVNSGWQAGHRRGYSEASAGKVQTVAPQPTQLEFRAYYQPPGLIGPPSSPTEDIWGDLPNVPR